MMSFKRFLTEDKSPVINWLITTFGKEQVRSSKVEVNLSVDHYRNMFKMLNKEIFADKLPDNFPISLMNSDEIVAEFKKRNCSDIKSDSFYAMYTAMCDLANDELIYEDELIILNHSELVHMNLMFSTAALCHEMIHLYDRMYGEAKRQAYLQIKSRIRSDAHRTPTFIQMREAAMKNGLNIVVDGGGMSYDELNKIALERMDDSDLEVIEENGKSYRKIPDDFKNTDTITKTGPHSFTLHYLD